MAEAQQAARQLQRLEEVCGTTLRALAADRALNFRALTPHSGMHKIPLFAPHLRIAPGAENLQRYRGFADAVGVRRRLTDEALHLQLCPSDPVSRLVFEMLEQFRVEALAPAHWPGVKSNLEAQFQRWTQEFHDSGLAETGLGILLFTVALICRVRVNGACIAEAYEDMLEATRAGIVPQLGGDLAGLKINLGEQQAYAQHALAIAAQVSAWIASEAADELPQAAKKPSRVKPGFRLLLNFDAEADEIFPLAASGTSAVFAATQQSYRAYTRRYDQEKQVDQLLRPELLLQLREELDQKARDCPINSARLAQQLTAVFATPRRDDWLFAQEDGLLDARRLAGLVSSPQDRRVFKQDRIMPGMDTHVSLLLDCSGSMKTHSDSIALLIDILARALQRAEISHEILGFTTASWHGGRAMQDWRRNGRPRNPGRLNEVLHLVFKSAQMKGRKARRHIAALLKPDLFRESVDAEAIEWACRRLENRDEARKVLVVISDGCPKDTATALTNDEFYLENHLRQVLDAYERQQHIEICALGVGLDLSSYYRRCSALDLTAGVKRTHFDDVLKLLSGRQHR